MTLSASTRLGSYEISDRIGVGGMGEVYRATDLKLGRQVAIKTLSPGFAEDTNRLARFEREAKLLASLNHAHIASVYGLDTDNGTLYIAMELVEGESLEARLRRGALSVGDSLEFGRQIAEALEAAHEKGVVHRDLKPANIMITPDDVVKVLDFGLAKAVSGDPGAANSADSPALSLAMTQQGLVLGTAAYMSPEQASGQAIDHRADVWAFGVVLFEMLTGQPLFGGESVPHILADVLKTEPDWSRLPGPLHPRVRQLLEACLTKKPRNRLHSMADARIEIEGALGDPEAASFTGGVPVAPAHATGRLMLVGLVAAVAGAAAMWALIPQPPPDPVVRSSLLLPDDQALQAIENGTLAISRDGMRVAYVANTRLYVRNLGESESVLVATADPESLRLGDPTFSPDGEWLVYFERPNFNETIVKRVPVFGGRPVTLFESSVAISLSWPSEDGILLATGPGILWVPIDGTDPEVLIPRADGEVLSSPEMLPGGNRLIFSRVEGGFGVNTFADDAEIVIQTIGREDRRVLIEGGAAPNYLSSGHLIFVRGDALFAIAFDAEQGLTSGVANPVVDGVQRPSARSSDHANYAVSDTGTLVMIPGAQAADNRMRLVLVDRDGNPSPIDVPPNQYRSPRISPNGRWLAVEVLDPSGRGQIWLYDLEGGSEIQPFTQEGSNTRPIFTPDSQRVTFGSERADGSGIFERPVDRSTVAVRLTEAEEGRRYFPDSWSPDDQTLAFTNAGAGTTDWDVWTFSRASGDKAIFASGDVNQFAASFSPEGNWIAYATTGEIGIEVRAFPLTPVVHRVTDDAVVPVWTRANELFFRTAQGGGRPQLTSVEVVTEGGFTVRNRQVVPIDGMAVTGGYRDFDVTPDGERFVMLFPVGDAETLSPTRIDITQNWVQELATLVPAD